jgi:hypothetical protein
MMNTVSEQTEDNQMVETHRKYVGNENAYLNFGWKSSGKRNNY